MYSTEDTNIRKTNIVDVDLFNNISGMNIFPFPSRLDLSLFFMYIHVYINDEPAAN